MTAYNCKAAKFHQFCMKVPEIQKFKFQLNQWRKYEIELSMQVNPKAATVLMAWGHPKKNSSSLPAPTIPT